MVRILASFLELWYFSEYGQALVRIMASLPAARQNEPDMPPKRMKAYG